MKKWSKIIRVQAPVSMGREKFRELVLGLRQYMKEHGVVFSDEEPTIEIIDVDAEPKT